jgi:sirohydrochlorin cobaltochelatase
LKGIVLFAHGSRDRDWARPFEQLAATLSRRTNAAVRLAYLELMQPTLGDAISALIAEGAESIRVVPVFLGQGGHTKGDLPKLAAAARERHPHVEISVDPAIGEMPSVIDAIAEALTRPAGRSSP